MSGIAGRSPFPSRNRRRSGGEGPEDSTAGGHSFTSPFMLHNGVLSSNSRISPSASSYISPANTSRRASRRFFESEQEPKRRSSRNDDGGVLGSLGKNAKAPTVVHGMDLAQIRALAQNSLQSSTATSSPEMAVFYASILYAKTQSQEDAFFYAQALAQNGETRRAVQILDRAGLFGGNCTLEQRLEATLLAAQALASRGEWQEALRLLEDASVSSNDTWASASLLEDGDDLGWQSLAQTVKVAENTINPVARLCLWRGKCYDETSHPPRAMIYWKRALAVDPKCVQALNSLLSRNLITANELHELITSLKFDSSLDWLRSMYLASIHSVPQDPLDESDSAQPSKTTPATPFMNGDASSIRMATPSINMAVLPDHLFDENNNDGDKKVKAKSNVQATVQKAFENLWIKHQLEQSPELLALAAIRSYRLYDFQSAYVYCQELTALDPLCRTASFVHVATLLALDHKRLLFGLAHEWVEASPEACRSWFAVGCYYYACGRYHVAQQHFCRATRLDPLCAEAWIAFGCSFAACDESDQALAAFRAAQRLAPAEHTAMLYMGMEYVRTNHLVLAQHSLMTACRSSGGDPLCLHELGVAAYHNKEYATAIEWLAKAVRAIVHLALDQDAAPPKTAHEYIEQVQDDFWEPTLFDLGHCYRKTRQFNEAIQCYEKCLVLAPGSTSGLSALGYTKHLKRDFDGAIDLYHRALSHVPDDPFCCEMLNRALNEAITVHLNFNEPPSSTGSGRQPLSPRPESDRPGRSPRQAANDFTFDQSVDSSGDVDMSMG